MCFDVSYNAPTARLLPAAPPEPHPARGTTLSGMGRATPAVTACRRAGVAFELHSYTHDPRVDRFGDEAVGALATSLGLAADRFFKTLVIDLAGHGTAIAVVPVARRLSLKAAAAALGARRAAMAEPATAQRVTGYVLGGISPLGTRTAAPTVIDASVLGDDPVLVSAGRRGLQLQLAPDDLLRLTAAVTAPIAAD